MKIVDINGCIGYDLKKVGPAVKPEELIREMDRSGTDAAVVWHTRSLMQVVDGNAEMKAVAEQYDGRFLPCFMVHPYMDDIQMPKDLAGYLRANRPACVTVSPKNHKYPLMSRYCGEMLKALEELRIPLMLRLEEVENYQEKVLEIADEYPELPIVITRYGYTFSMFIRTAMRTTKNIYFNLGFIENASELNQLVREYGAERFILGSTAGLLTGGGMGLVYLGEFTGEQKELMLGGNWQRLQEGIKWA